VDFKTAKYGWLYFAKKGGNLMNDSLIFEEVAVKYPDFPKLIMLKTDIHRRGVYYTPNALSAVDETRHQLGGTHLFGTRDGKLTKRPEAFVLRDGTSVLSTPTPLENNPYIVDLIDDKLILTDEGREIEEVFYWDKPDFYDKRTSSGVLMQNIVGARPQRLYLIPNRYCYFWNDDMGCKFCDIVSNLRQQKNEIEMQTKIKPKDVSETIREALKERGRFSAICLTSGSNFHGEIPFDKEIDYYIEILNAIGENFSSKKFPSQLICSAVTSKQLKRLYNETGISSLTMDIEVLNENIFNIVCPGKAKWVGYKEWKKRLIDAVEIFGEGRVNTGIVSGVELAKPFGFRSEDEALEAVLKEADELASYGVSTVNMVWVPRPNTYLAGQKNASLEYYVRLSSALQKIRKNHSLTIDFDDYRRCGNHPDSDLARAF
jgi:biotin synthase-related radical SAM superfamily protein